MLDFADDIAGQVVARRLDDCNLMRSFNRPVVIRISTDRKRPVTINLPTCIKFVILAVELDVAEHRMSSIAKSQGTDNLVSWKPVGITS